LRAVLIAFAIRRGYADGLRAPDPKAIRMISSVIEVILISICRAVTPLSVPATLKSMSPKMIFVAKNVGENRKAARFLDEAHRNTRNRCWHRKRPHPWGERTNRKRSAIEDEPFDSVTSDTTRTVYGNLSAAGRTGCMARHANLPWPISRRPGLPRRTRFTNRVRREVVMQHEKGSRYSPVSASTTCSSCPVPSVVTTSALCFATRKER